MYHSACRVSKDLGGQMPVFLKNNKEKSWKEEGMDVRVEHSTLLCWKNYSLYLSIKTFKPTTPVIPIWSITNTHVLLKCLGSQSKQSSPAGHAHTWFSHTGACPRAHHPAAVARRMRMNQCRHQLRCRQGVAVAPCTLHASHPFCQVSWNAWSPCFKHRGNCNHAYTK